VDRSWRERWDRAGKELEHGRVRCLSRGYEQQRSSRDPSWEVTPASDSAASTALRSPQ